MKLSALQTVCIFLVNINIIHVLQYSHSFRHELACDYSNFQFVKLIYHVSARFSFEVRKSRIALSNVEIQIRYDGSIFSNQLCHMCLDRDAKTKQSSMLSMIMLLKPVSG